jgi:DNA-binding winged helix-turn-helix (wHTH) protein
LQEQFRLAEWEVHPDLNEIARDDTRVRVEPKVMQLLAFLAEHPGKVLSRRQILDSVWEGTFVGDEALTYAMTELRRALEDDAKDPRFIETIPKRGYRLIAPVSRPTAAVRPADRAGRRRLGWIASVLASAALLAAAAAAWLRWRGPALPFGSGDRILVTRFENRTGEPLFDSSVEHWLERELGNSRFVRVVPPERVEDTLRLMRRPPETVIDRLLGREICLRDGGIRGLITGRIDKVGSRFLLGADLVDPGSGEIVASRAEEAATTDDVLPAMRRLSSWLRATLGEKLAAIPPGRELERVTTPSLRALQLYTQAERLVRLDRRTAAAELLKQCIAEDPSFASAHILLAWSLPRQEGPEGYLPAARRTVELAGGASERERYFILGSYYTMLGELEKSIPPYEALRAIDPEHYWGIGTWRTRIPAGAALRRRSRAESRSPRRVRALSTHSTWPPARSSGQTAILRGRERISIAR